MNEEFCYPYAFAGGVSRVHTLSLDDGTDLLAALLRNSDERRSSDLLE